MINKKDLTIRSWRDYELLDSGDNKKLERFGEYILARPETQAIWKPARPELWKRAHGEFLWQGGKGSWQKKDMLNSWEIKWNDIRAMLKLTAFKHIGIFPEQAANWEWIQKHTEALQKPRVLNLFGYTGLASIAAAQAGAIVTHVDASKQSNAWAKENATLSEVPEGAIRYLVDDALKFSEREVRRGASYEGIILDPPAFGRGAKGEVWKIEDDLSKLLEALLPLLTKKSGSFFLLNGYAAGYSPLAFLQAAEGIFAAKKTVLTGEFGELQTEEGDRGNGSNRCVPSGIYVRFTI